MKRTSPGLWGTEVDYSYDTVPQAGTAGLAHNWPRGHTLGGSSSINAMVYLRGHRSDFDNWAKSGCTGWDYESVLPYFRRMETVTGRDPYYRGTDGPMLPAPAPAGHANPLSQVFVDGAAAAGFPVTEDFNGAHTEGAGWHDLSISGGVRQSTAAAYLRPVRVGRPNLTISTGSRARRLRFDGDRCVGVEFERSGALMTAYADAEVVISAGRWTRPGCCSCPGSGRPPSSKPLVSTWCTTCPGWVATCTTTRCAASSTRRPDRSPPGGPTTPRRRCCGAAMSRSPALTCS